LATAIPFCLLSAFFLEASLKPTFSGESALGGAALWVVIAVWFYIIPVV